MVKVRKYINSYYFLIFLLRSAEWSKKCYRIFFLLSGTFSGTIIEFRLFWASRLWRTNPTKNIILYTVYCTSTVLYRISRRFFDTFVTLWYKGSQLWYFLQYFDNVYRFPYIYYKIWYFPPEFFLSIYRYAYCTLKVCTMENNYYSVTVLVIIQ